MTSHPTSTHLLAHLRRSIALPLSVMLSMIVPLFMPLAAFADSPPPAPGGQANTYDASLGVPETGDAVTNNIGSPVSVDAVSGSANMAVSFRRPSARGHAQPHLGLSYQSTSGTGVGGWGWNLTLPSIERTPLSGPPTYADPANGGVVDFSVEDRFTFAGQSLVPVCHIPDSKCTSASGKGTYTNGSYSEALPSFALSGGWTYFRLETGGPDERIFWSGDHLTFVVQNKTGETMEFGHPLNAADLSLDATDRDLDHSASVFRWNLVRQYDSERDASTGAPVNRIVYRWAAQAGSNDTRTYLTDVYDSMEVSFASYTAPADDLKWFAHHVHLTYERLSWADTGSSFRAPIWRARPLSVLSRVDVTAWSDITNDSRANPPPSGYQTRRLVRRYWLTHQPDPYANRSYLKSVQIEGRCETMGPDLEQADYTVRPDSHCDTTLHPTTFEYSLNPPLPTFTRASIQGTFPGASIGNYIDRIADMNSDGVPDVVTRTGDGGAFVNLVAAGSTADDAGARVPLFFSYPAGYQAPAPPADTFPLCYLPTTLPQNFWAAPNVGMWLPGDYLGNGHLNALLPGRVDTLNGASMLHSAIATSQPVTVGGGPAWTDYGADAPPFPIWTPTYVTDAPSLDVFEVNAKWVYPEAVIAVIDVDGDGLDDAITDTAVDFVTTTWGCIPNYLNKTPYQRPTGAPNTHLFSLRSTKRSTDGRLAPFSVIAPNVESHDVGARFPVIPSNGQYYARISDTDPNTLRMFGATYASPAYHASACIPAGPTLGCASVYPAQSVVSFFEDMNGDGLVDWTTVDLAGTKLVYYVGHGDGTFGSCGDGRNLCTGSSRFQGPLAGTAMSNVPALPTGARVVVHDVTGDGLPDLFVMNDTTLTLYVNQHGLGFSGKSVIAAPSFWSSASPLYFGDMNGSGTDDLVFAYTSSKSPMDVSYIDVWGGDRPGLLTTAVNGLGASTQITYASTHALALKAAAEGHPWASTSPQILHHVTSVTSTNNLPGSLKETRTTDYSYRDPAYDGRDRQFVGFRTVTTRSDGDANHPSVNTTSSYLTGVCELDLGGTSCPANPIDRPFLALRGRGVSSETFDDAGHYLSTIHTTYNVNTPIVGLDGRKARFAYQASTDTYLYDPSLVASASSTMTFTDASFDDGTPTVGRSLMLHGSLRLDLKQIRRTRTLDLYGNQIDTNDLGVYLTDNSIHTTATWMLPPGDATGWTWRMRTQHSDPFPSISGIGPDQAHDVTFDYYADGLQKTATTPVTGSAALVRANAYGAVAPDPPKRSIEGSTIQLAAYRYDPFGNPTYVSGPRGLHCEKTEYNDDFAQLATAHEVFFNGCDSAAGLVTNQSWDRGFERPLMKIAPDGQTTTVSYDTLGRVKTMTLPNETTGAAGSYVSISMGYAELPPFARTSIQTFDGTAQRQTWKYSDGWGQPLVSIAQADASAGDGGDWVVAGGSERTARGTVARAHLPFFWKGDPTSYPFTAGFPSAYRRAVYDAFGRTVATFDLDGSALTQHVYHALDEQTFDAAQLNDPKRFGNSTGTVLDGHGRVVQTTRRGKDDVSLLPDTVSVWTTYNATGKPTRISQVHSLDGASVVRTLQYDSLGRMVSNIEPNTSKAGIGWRYVYDDDSNLIGTSDARGCGENISYDPMGRVIAEDYSPCTATQAMYSAPQSDLTGVEVYYNYDPAVAGLLDGRLLEIYDRAAHTSFSYDGRGRVKTVNRSIIRPDVTMQTPVATRYSSWVFTTTTGYDAANRVVSQSTGADVTQLLGASAASVVTATYSARGALSSVQGSYGPLVRKATIDAQGRPFATVYGDAASTTSYACYNNLQQLTELALSRGTAPPTCAGTNVTAGVAVKPAVLADETFAYDLAGNPISIDDHRTTSDWPSDAPAPASRFFEYDDAYRATKVTYNYATADHTDRFVSPQPAVTALVNPAPAVSTPHRIGRQSLAFDWLGNTVQTTDEAGVFFDRSLGNVTNGTTTGTTTTAPNQLRHAESAGATGGSLDAQYDASGNLVTLMLARSSQTCTPASCARQYVYDWDELGHLSHATRYDGASGSAAATVDYKYDSSGARVLRASTPATGNGATTYSVEIFPTLRLNRAHFDTATGLYERTPATETAYLALGGAVFGRVVTTASSPTTPIPDPIPTPPPASFASASFAPASINPVIYTQHVLLEFSDSLGSGGIVIDKATGELVESTSYQMFGAVESDYHAAAWQSFREEYKFTGKEDDVEVGVTYFGARYYSPQLNRWLSPDPLTIHGLGADLNPYAYVHGRATSAVDPDGLQETTPPVDTCSDGGCPISGGELPKLPPSGAPTGGAGSGNDTSWLAPYGQGGVPLLDYWMAVSETESYGDVMDWGLISRDANESGGWAYNPNGGANIFGSHDTDVAADRYFRDNPGARQVLTAVLSLAPPVGMAIGIIGVLDNSKSTTSRVISGLSVAFGMAAALGGLAKAGRAAAGGREASLASRADEIHGALDSIAQRQRVTAVLDTSAGRVVASGGRDLTPGQRALLQAGERYNTAPGVHAEVTAIMGARQTGAQLRGIETTSDFCPACIDYIEQSGGVITGPRTAVWPQ